jgi:hypothetical protein
LTIEAGPTSPPLVAVFVEQIATTHLCRSGTEKIQVENLPVKVDNLSQGEEINIDFDSVIPGYFRLLGVRLTNFYRGHVLNFILSFNLGDQLTLPYSPHPTTPSLFFVAAPSASVNPQEFFCCGAVVVCCYSFIVFLYFRCRHWSVVCFYFQIRPSLSPASLPRNDDVRTDILVD